MFADFVSRLLRRSWNYGANPIRGKTASELTNEDLAQAIESVAESVQQLAEEIASLNGLETPAVNLNTIEAKHSCPGVAELPPKMWKYDEFCAAGGSDNPLSHLTPSGNIKNGLAHKFRGYVMIEGGLIIRERIPNDPIGPVPGPQGPAGPGAVGGGGITYITNAGNIVAAEAVGFTNSTITARAMDILGSGSAYIQSIAANFLLVDGASETIYNPYSYAIPTGIYVTLGKVARGANTIWCILGVDGAFEPAYAVRNNSDTNIAANTTATVSFASAQDIHKYPNDTTVFELSSSELTIKKSGLYEFSFIVPIRPVAASSEGQIWLEEGGTKIPGSAAAFYTPLNSVEVSSACRTLTHKVDVSGGNKVYRVRVRAADGFDIVGADDTTNGGYARLDVRWVRNI